MKVIVFFSFEISLQDWADSGLLKREIVLYKQLIEKYGVQVSFLTFGDEQDRKWEADLGGIKLLPIYERIPKSKSWVMKIIRTCLIPWKIKQELDRADLYKTNQMMGAWVPVLAKVCCRKPLLLRCG